MYDGPVADAFLHTPWMGGEDPADPRGDRVDWSGDPRLQRVMHTFRHNDADGSPATAIDAAALQREMAQAGVERVVLPAKIYYPLQAKGVVAVHRQLEAMCAASSGTMKWACSLVPPELGPGTYWDFMQNPRLIASESARPGIAGVHITPSSWGTPPNHKWYYPAYAACVENNLPLLAYVGAPGPLWPMDPNDPSHLDEVALAFPDLKIVAHHIGDPWVDVAIRLAARHTRTSTSARRRGRRRPIRGSCSLFSRADGMAPGAATRLSSPLTFRCSICSASSAICGSSN